MNSTINTLVNRVSSPRLQAPAPSEEQLDQLFAAAARAADHGMLKPYRFLVIAGQTALENLGEVFQQAAECEDPNLAPAQLARMATLPMRAPMIVVAIACCQAHPKVPFIEQQYAAAAATQNFINAAYALDIGVCWRTGAVAYYDGVKRALGLLDNESIIGFLYLGTASAPLRQLREQDRAITVDYWPT